MAHQQDNITKIALSSFQGLTKQYLCYSAVSPLDFYPFLIKIQKKTGFQFSYTNDFTVEKSGKFASFQMASRALQESDNITFSIIENKTSVYDQDFISKTIKDKTQQGTFFIEPFYLLGNKNSFCSLPPQYKGVYDYFLIISYDKTEEDKNGKPHLPEEISKFVTSSNFTKLDTTVLMNYKNNSVFFYTLYQESEYYCNNGKNLRKEKVLGKTKKIPKKNLKKEHTHYGSTTDRGFVTVEDKYFMLLHKDISFE